MVIWFVKVSVVYILVLEPQRKCPWRAVGMVLFSVLHPTHSPLLAFLNEEESQKSKRRKSGDKEI